MAGNILKRQITCKCLRDIADCFFNNLVIFCWNIIKHTLCKDFDGFLKLITEVIQSVD